VLLFPQLNTEWAQVEVIDLINDGSGLGFGIIGGRSTGVVVKTILPGGVADRVSAQCYGPELRPSYMIQDGTSQRRHSRLILHYAGFESSKLVQLSVDLRSQWLCRSLLNIWGFSACCISLMSLIPLH
jgi:hypothetical protein